MIKVVDFTSKPLSLMGKVASGCWNSSPKDTSKVAIECINSGHGRVLEFADVIIEIDGYSARMIRELYTHIVGTSRLQASTRYINYGDFEFIIPKSISSDEKAMDLYSHIMIETSDTYGKLQDLGIPKEDIANILPLGMVSKMYLKINVRAILHMAEVRMCNRAYHEFREFMEELQSVISQLDNEWEYIASQMKPKCEVYGYCNERNSCYKQGG